MIKQYSLHEDLWPWWHINLYHNGQFIKTLKIDSVSMDKEIKGLEDKGYERGYTESEICAQEKKLRIQKHKYDRMRERAIGGYLD